MPRWNLLSLIVVLTPSLGRALLGLVGASLMLGGAAASGQSPTETLSVPFTLADIGVSTSLSYSGAVMIEVSGTGQALHTQRSDAFYLFTDAVSQAIPPVHNQGGFTGLMINGHCVNSYCTGDPNLLGAPTPAYSSSHRYRFTIRAPGGHLVFSVGDPQSGCGDNSGSFTVKVYPVGKIELVDPYPDLLPLASYFGDPDLLAGLGSQVSAAVTDGGTVLLVRIESDETMTLSLTDPGGAPADPAWGVLSDLTGSPSGATIQVDPVASMAGDFVFALYRAPIDFPGGSGDVATGIGIGISATSVSGSWTRSLQLHAPPVVLVHGLWSEAMELNGLKIHLTNAGFTICPGCVPDYGLREPAGSFDPFTASLPINVLIQATHSARGWLRYQGIAVCQVDVVGHSLGGLLARARARQTFYANKENCFEGDFHKLITIGSPHLGSPLADLLIERKCTAVSVLKTNLAGVFSKMQRPIGPAVYQMQTSSFTLEHIGETTIPSHAIRGVEPASSRVKYVLDLILSWLDGPSIDELLGGPGEHDTIVPLESQGGDGTGQSHTVADVVHADFLRSSDVGETESPDVHAQVADMLLASVTDAEFGTFPAFERPGDPHPDQNCPKSNARERSATAATVTLTPAAGSVVAPGALVDIEFTIAGGDPVDGAFFTVGNVVHLIEGPGPFAFSYTVPAEAAGTIEIAAWTYGSGPESYSASTWVEVGLSAELEELELLPEHLAFDQLGQPFQIRVVGHYDDGSQHELTAAGAGVSYATLSGGTAVVSVTSEGVVEAQGLGQDIVMVSHSGLWAQTTAEVSFTNRPPSLSPLPEVTMQAGDAVDIPLSAQDPDVDELVLEGSQLPAFATVVDLGGGFGELRLRPDPADVGLYSLVLVVSDQGIPPLASSRTCTVQVDEVVLFADDFESGDLTAWSSSSGSRSGRGTLFYD